MSRRKVVLVSRDQVTTFNEAVNFLTDEGYYMQHFSVNYYGWHAVMALERERWKNETQERIKQQIVDLLKQRPMDFSELFQEIGWAMREEIYRAITNLSDGKIVFDEARGEYKIR